MRRSDFPETFTFGTATSAYQIEGTRFGRCGPSHWDLFAHQGGTAAGQNGQTACAHYEKWPSDFDLLKEAGFDAYRFSIAWPRIQPEGKGRALKEGLDFYDQLIDGLLARGIAPHLTLYHWDLPLALAEKGGWTHRDTAMRFADYAEIVSYRFQDRLSSIATINEPWCISWLSYFLGQHAPGTRDLPSAVKAMHNVMLAHGTALEAMRAAGISCDLSIVLNMEAATPASDRDEDRYAAQIYDGIYNRWFAGALFHGAYPRDILEHLEPHLPEAWQEDMGSIAAPMDWLGLNYYTRSVIADDGTGRFPYARPVLPDYDPSDKARSAMNWETYPQGLSEFLLRLHREYSKDLPLVVSENGMACADILQDGAVQDSQRIEYFAAHLNAVQEAITQGAPVQGYFAWSLLDNFEWAFGYDKRFGLVHVDFATQTRSPKASWSWWQAFMG
jgi:beta-glucosidase